MGRRGCLGVVCLLLVALPGGCAKKSSGAAAPVDAAEAYAPTGDPEQDLATYEVALARAERDLRSLGIDTPLPDNIARNEPRAPKHDLGSELGASSEADEVAGADEEETGEAEMPAEPAAGPEPEPAPAPPSAAGAKLAEEEAQTDRAEVVTSQGSRVRLRDRHGHQDPARDRCTNICELATTVCDLEAKICSLANAHAEDDRYANACTRAQGDCATAEEACDACSP